MTSTYFPFRDNTQGRVQGLNRVSYRTLTSVTAVRYPRQQSKSQLSPPQPLQFCQEDQSLPDTPFPEQTDTPLQSWVP